MGFHQVALIYHQPNLTLTLERCQSHLLVLESEISLTVGEEDEAEEDDEGINSPFSRVSLKSMKDPEDELGQAPVPQ